MSFFYNLFWRRSRLQGHTWRPRWVAAGKMLRLGLVAASWSLSRSTACGVKYMHFLYISLHPVSGTAVVEVARNGSRVFAASVHCREAMSVHSRNGEFQGTSTNTILPVSLAHYALHTPGKQVMV